MFENKEILFFLLTGTQCVDGSHDSRVSCGKMGPQPVSKSQWLRTKRLADRFHNQPWTSISLSLSLGNQGHICVQCGGEIFVGLAGTGSANFDFVYLQPGSWGRFANQPILQCVARYLSCPTITFV